MRQATTKENYHHNQVPKPQESFYLTKALHNSYNFPPPAHKKNSNGNKTKQDKNINL